MIVTIIIIAITCIVSYMAWKDANLMDKLIFYPYQMNNNKQELYRFITAGFVHANPQHLIFNMITLFFFGRNLEEIFGAQWFAIFYLTALVASSLIPYLKNKNNAYYKALGASGAISAVLFAIILFAPWSSIYVYFIKLPAIVYAVLYVGYSLYMNKQQTDNIGHDVHLWGALYGIIFTILLMPNVVPYFIDKLTHPVF